MTSAPQPGEPLGTPTLTQLADELSGVRADLDTLHRDLGDLAEHTATAVDALTTRSLGSPASDDGSQVWCWRGLDPLAQHALWAELLAWVGWLRGRYPLGRRLPGCWWRHPELVEEITALWSAWRGAYTNPAAPATAAIDWHDRWLPGLLQRLTAGPFATDCADGHHDRSASAYAQRPVDDPTAFHQHLSDLLHTRAAPKHTHDDSPPSWSNPPPVDLTLLDGSGHHESQGGEPR